ncbi:hypothetical protein [Flavobacterium laiguense]|uniref:Uncharacterized protein n=1 Tax=Flavobacterium laiguense TaxID=2169409 RepID=A0A2U1JK08_9FLAO|nr:hypothetical protein [Flavobacterium laiguense]PWA05477.1 hypothetical protein DB891_17050 [Flavobacterium laiguense]
MWYKIDFDRLILLLLPTFLRKSVLFGYIKALITPIASLHYKWEQMRAENLKKLSYNSQRCYLRGALNDKYDPDLRRITIDGTLNIDQDYIYTPAENLDVYLRVMYLETEFNYANSKVDYLVNVPRDLMNTKLNEIVATIEFYNLAGKQYQIISI